MKQEASSTPKNPPPTNSAAVSSPSRWNSFLRYWLPLLIWMSLIYSLSTGAGAPRNTSRIIGPILRFFVPSTPDETVREIQLVIRKTAHFVEYIVLVILIWRVRRKPIKADNRPWQWKPAIFAFSLATLFAITDEWHQSFVPSRDGRAQDVLIDSSGAAAGMVGLWFVGRRRKRW